MLQVEGRGVTERGMLSNGPSLDCSLRFSLSIDRRKGGGSPNQKYSYMDLESICTASDDEFAFLGCFGRFSLSLACICRFVQGTCSVLTLQGCAELQE